MAAAEMTLLRMTIVIVLPSQAASATPSAARDIFPDREIPLQRQMNGVSRHLDPQAGRLRASYLGRRYPSRWALDIVI
jgi:hypothetical protein